MKTTIDISDTVLNEARKLGARDGLTIKAMVELGLRKVIAERKNPVNFTLRNASFKGNGLQPELKNASWEQLRELAYGEHGG